MSIMSKTVVIETTHRAYDNNTEDKIISILGRSDGYLAKNSTVSLVVPCVNKNHITPHSESWQTVIWHLIISHPRIKETSTKW